ncbi:hypothetical protein PRIC2_001308 [Phytophthora ramorum]
MFIQTEPTSNPLSAKFLLGCAVLDDRFTTDLDTTILPEDAEVATTKEPLEQRIRPSVQDGGGNIFHQVFDEKTGTVTV